MKTLGQQTWFPRRGDRWFYLLSLSNVRYIKNDVSGDDVASQPISPSDQHPILSIPSRFFYLRLFDMRHAPRRPMLFHGGLSPARHTAPWLPGLCVRPW